MRVLLVATALFCSSAAWADPVPTVADILGQIDDNLTFETRESTITMKVATARRTRSYNMHTYGRGETQAAIEYLAPARDKGTRMLRKDEELWMYLPSTERVQKISGHMLRQGMMGSDVSYEDMMAANSWEESYDAKVEGPDTVDGEACWKLVMTAKDDSVTYPKRVAWIDQKNYIPVKQELYALSGMLLKTWTMSGIKEYEGGRKFPSVMTISDELQTGSKTTIILEEVKFGVELQEEVFAVRWLERG